MTSVEEGDCSQEWKKTSRRENKYRVIRIPRRRQNGAATQMVCFDSHASTLPRIPQYKNLVASKEGNDERIRQHSVKVILHPVLT